MMRVSAFACFALAGALNAACGGGAVSDGGTDGAAVIDADSNADTFDAVEMDIQVAPETGCSLSTSDYCFQQTPGGGCGDIAVMPNCVNGHNVCPSGTVSASQCGGTSTNPAWCPTGTIPASGDACMLPDGGAETDTCRYPTAMSGCPSHLVDCTCTSMQWSCHCVF